MNFPTNSPTPPLFARPVRHELNVEELRTVRLRKLPELHEALSTMIVVANGFLNAYDNAGEGGLPEDAILAELREHLGDLREAVVLTMEEGRPSTLEEAGARTRLLLQANIAAGASIEEAVARLDYGFREPWTTRS